MQYLLELRPELGWGDGLQALQLSLITHGAHQGEACPAGEQGLDGCPDLHIAYMPSIQPSISSGTLRLRRMGKHCPVESLIHAQHIVRPGSQAVSQAVGKTALHAS